MLDTPSTERARALAPHLANFPYVNGALFRENFRPPAFTEATRQRLIDCTYFDWSRISPAVFGSLFQSIADPKQRRTLGAHYTSEPNILKVLDPLLLDGLRQELATAGTNRAALTRLQQRVAGLRLLDPACGCGNFLVVAYRELRLVEHAVLDRLFERGSAGGVSLNLALYQQVRVEQVAGIEVEEFAARIAEVALWLMDHQLNLALSARFDQRYVRLPLTGGARILNENALRVNWEAEFPKLDYIVGNPPFVGSKLMTEAQRLDLLAVAGPGLKGAGVLDLVAAWYLKGGQYVQQHPATRVAFVSTNSVTQGEQVGLLWGEILNRYRCHIQFAHRTFRWSNEARGNAAVYCVIIGYGAEKLATPRLFDYVTPRSAPQQVPAKVINPYLVDGPEVLVYSRSTPLSPVPAMVSGNKPIDDGNYLFTPERKADFLALEPQAAPFFKRWLGGEEYINGTERWCLWLGDASPSELNTLPESKKLIEAVRRSRAASKSLPTQKLAATPTRFHVEFIPTGPYLAIPEVSSERRPYIPIGFLDTDVIASNKLRLVPNASPYLFGVLTSSMHMTWMRQVGGRLKSDYSYSAGIVYNNYPFPPAPTEAQRQAVTDAAEAVLAARAAFPGENLAALYDPTTMPPALARAHAALDRAVDRCYRPQPFATELARLEFLFGLYQQLSAPVLGAAPKAKAKSRVA